MANQNLCLTSSLKQNTKNHQKKQPHTQNKLKKKKAPNQKPTWKVISDKLIITYKMKLAAQVSQVMLFNISLVTGLYNVSSPLFYFFMEVLFYLPDVNHKYMTWWAMTAEKYSRYKTPQPFKPLYMQLSWFEGVLIVVLNRYIFFFSLPRLAGRKR